MEQFGANAVTRRIATLALLVATFATAERQSVDTSAASPACDNVTLPVYVDSHLSFTLELTATPADELLPPNPTAEEPQERCRYDRPFDVPQSMISVSSESEDESRRASDALDKAGGNGAAGSFTSPGANERLRISGVGFLEDRMEWFYLAALQDEHGTRPIVAFDGYTRYQGLCFDRHTQTHAAVFTYRYQGTCCPWQDTAYWHYSPDERQFVQAFLDGHAEQPVGADAECLWRQKTAALETYRDALYALRVRELPGLSKDGTPGLLPTRRVPAAVVDEQLGRLRGLSVAHVRSPKIESPRWRIVVVDYAGVPRRETAELCEGALLAWDGTRQEWRSIYDCADVSEIEIHGNRLSASLYKGTVDCGWLRQGLSCYLEVDLATWQARLWDYPHGNHWRNGRNRPER